MTKTQIDRLGQRLKLAVTEGDLRLLDSYRRSFAEAYESVVGRIRENVSLEPTGRPAKSTTSIVEKLCRESIRLSQVQDIAGCRLVVPDVTKQDQVVEHLRHAFEDVAVVDRRQRPSHGYRAVHVIVTITGMPIEVQVRTALQHLWAEQSEKLSDVFDPKIKYGGGNAAICSLLNDLSGLVVKGEELEKTHSEMVALLPSVGKLLPGRREYLKQIDAKLAGKVVSLNRRIAALLGKLSEITLDPEGENNVVPD